MKRALVAGAGGFIGGYLVKSLLEQDYIVSAVDMKPKSDWYQLHSESKNFVRDLS